MRVFLVTGNPGSAKSTVAKELALRGFSTIDPDYDPLLSFWEDQAGNRVLLEDGPAAPDEAWLRSHRWVWSRERLEELVAEADQPVFVCGIALNLAEVVDLFEGIFLLHIDEATQEERLVAHDARNPPGRGEAGKEEIRAGRPIFEAEMRELGAIALDGARPPSKVADEIVARAGHHLG